MPRVKSIKDIEKGFDGSNEDIRFATPREVAGYRAKRLKCSRLVEIGAGVGFQTIAFAKTCKKVTAIEIDSRKAGLLRKNMKTSGARSVTVLHGDALDRNLVRRLGRIDVVFVDTERPPAEKERKLESIKPDIRKIIETYSPITGDIAIEVPPHLKDLPSDCEREYISLNGKLNRLTLYFGNLKKADNRVVVLPEGKSIKSSGKPLPDEVESAEGFKYLYEIDPTVILAGVIGEISKGMSLINYSGKLFLLSNHDSRSAFLKKYGILYVCREKDVKDKLKELSCKDVILRQKVSPEDYWKKRKSFEVGLEGKKSCHLFGDEKETLIAELI